MNTYLQFIVAALMAGTLAGCSQQSSRQEENAPREVTIAISPFYASDKKAIAMTVASWLVRQAGCKARLIDGWTAETIADIEVPKVTYFKEAAVARTIGEPFQKWVAWSKERPIEPQLDGSGAVNVPKLLARLAQERAVTEHLIIIGSPVLRFPNQTNYDFARPFLRYPDDGQISKDKSSPFAREGLERSLNGTKVLFLYPHTDTSTWPGDYERKLHHFFGVFVASRGGSLLAFTPNLEAGLKLLNRKTQLPADEFPVNLTGIGMIDARPSTPVAKQRPSPTSVVIASGTTASSALPPTPALKVTASHPTSSIQPPKPEPRPQPLPVQAAPQVIVTVPANPPTPIVVSTVTNITVITTQVVQAVRTALPEKGVTLQLRYPGSLNADLDLFVRPHADAEEISYHRNWTVLGSYDYRFDFASGEFVKSIHLPAGLDVAKAVAWVNYRRGFGRATAKVVWLTPSDSREVGTSLFANRGGDGNHRTEFFRKRSDCWLKINLPALLSAPAATLRDASGNPSANHPVRPVSGEADKPSTATATRNQTPNRDHER